MSRFVQRASGIVAVALVACVVTGAAAVAYAQYSGATGGRTTPAVPSLAYPARWEYGRFRYTPTQTDWSWRSGQDRITGDAGTLWRKLDGPQRTVSGEIWYGEMVSVLGQQGWEIIMMRDFDAGSEVWFRRPAR